MKNATSVGTRQAGPGYDAREVRYVSQASRLQQRRRMLILLIFFLMPMTQAATLTVLAASSTTDAMDEAAELFTKWTGHTVRFSFGSSGALARQIQSGAPADLFLSANQKWMDALAAGGLMDESSRVDLLRNRLVLIVPTGETARAVGPCDGVGRAVIQVVGSPPAPIGGPRGTEMDILVADLAERCSLMSDTSDWLAVGAGTAAGGIDANRVGGQLR